MSKTIIANATPIVSLCTIGREDILQRLFRRIIIARAVDQELRAADKPGAAFSDLDWVEVRPVLNQELVRSLQKDLDMGEAETIALALQLNAQVVLIDESAGYQIAKNFDLPVIRTLSMLKTAKHQQIIPEVRPLVEQMVQQGRWYAETLITQFLREIGE